MKQMGFLLLLLSVTPAVWSQETPAEIIQRQEAEANIKELRSKITDLEATCQSLQKQIDSLERELGKLREDLRASRNNNALASVEEGLKRMAKDITEVDRKRQADNDRVTSYIEESFGRLEKKLSVPPSRPPPAAPPAHTKQGSGGTPPPSGKTYEYAVQSGDTLTGILNRLRKEGFKVTQKQVEDANPNVNWKRIQVGQKIFIPAPPP
jgi:peptidoglycan hydrolase CwlO-like protein